MRESDSSLSEETTAALHDDEGSCTADIPLFPFSSSASRGVRLLRRAFVVEEARFSRSGRESNNLPSRRMIAVLLCASLCFALDCSEEASPALFAAEDSLCLFSRARESVSIFTS